MLDRPSGGLRILHDPLAVLFLQRVRNLHRGAGRAPGFRLEFHLRLRFVPLNGNIGYVHIHRAEIDRFQGDEMLVDSGANAVGIALLLLTPRKENQNSNDR